jgi:predicted  nucleic acid-binding Zn-ribbon protein
MPKSKITLEYLAKKIDEGFKKFATKDDLKRFATKDDIENLAAITKQGFDSVDFKFLIVNEQIRNGNLRLDHLEKKVDKIHDEVIKTNDAFTRLKNYVDAETAAVRDHLLRIDEKIGLI